MLLVLGVGFAGIQFSIAKLNSAHAAQAMVILVVGAVILLIGYALFLLRAKVSISQAEVVVHDWLGRRSFCAGRAAVNLRLVSVRDMGIAEEFAVLWAREPTGKTSAVLLRRVAWGDGAIAALRTQLEGRRGELHFHTTSKSAFSEEFPHVHVQNLPAIAVVVVVVLLFAVFVSRP